MVEYCKLFLFLNLQVKISSHFTKPTETQKQIKLDYTKFKTLSLRITQPPIHKKNLLRQTNIVYKFTRLFQECFTENSIIPNSYIGYKTTTLSRRLTYHLSDISAIKQLLMTNHKKDTDKLKSPDIRKIQINNTKIIYRKNNKNRLQILEAITIKNKKKQL